MAVQSQHEPSNARQSACAPIVEEAAAEGLAGCSDIEWRLEDGAGVYAMADR